MKATMYFCLIHNPVARLLYMYMLIKSILLLPIRHISKKRISFVFFLGTLFMLSGFVIYITCVHHVLYGNRHTWQMIDRTVMRYWVKLSWLLVYVFILVQVLLFTFLFINYSQILFDLLFWHYCSQKQIKCDGKDIQESSIIYVMYTEKVGNYCCPWLYSVCLKTGHF